MQKQVKYLFFNNKSAFRLVDPDPGPHCGAHGLNDSVHADKSPGDWRLINGSFGGPHLKWRLPKQAHFREIGSMHSSLMNMVFMAVLGAVLFVWGPLSKVADQVYASKAPETKGFAIEGVEDEGHGGGQTEVAAVTPLSVLLASATESGGEKISKRCISCHTFDKDGPSRTGPNLWGIVGSPIAQRDGFSYSSALKDYGAGDKVWDYDSLNSYIENPKGYIPGNSMNFAGLRKPEQRAALIKFLRSKADTPLPLPEPPAAEPTSAEESAG